MSLIVVFRGRLGNNLFQYALGRLVAEETGAAMECVVHGLPVWHPTNGLRLPGPGNLFDLAASFPFAPLRLGGRRFSGDREYFGLGGTYGRDGQRVSVERLFAASRSRPVQIDGFFQRYGYYAEHLGRIGRWFQPVGAPDLPHPVEERDVLLNVRRGHDFAAFSWTLPLSYYAGVLDKLRPKGRLYVCGTGVDQPFLRHFSKHRPIFVAGTPLEHFVFMKRFRTLIIPNSTFSWWSALLSNATMIIAPVTRASAGFAFSGYKKVDLDMRCPRYVPVMVPRFAESRVLIVSAMAGATVSTVRGHLVVSRRGLPDVHVTESPDMQVALDALAKSRELLPRSIARMHLSSRLLSGLAQRGLLTATTRVVEPA